MKKTLSMVLTIILAVVLCVAAVGIGAYRGWAKERTAVESAFVSDDALKDQLATRAMDTANLLVVAARHLPAEDADLAELRAARETLLAPSATAAQLIEADETITSLAATLGEKLPALSSVQASARDTAYVVSLTRTLAEKTGAAKTYAESVARFNERLKTSPTGILAGWLGVAPLNAQ